MWIRRPSGLGRRRPVPGAGGAAPPGAPVDERGGRRPEGRDAAGLDASRSDRVGRGGSLAPDPPSEPRRSAGPSPAPLLPHISVAQIRAHLRASRSTSRTGLRRRVGVSPRRSRAAPSHRGRRRSARSERPIAYSSADPAAIRAAQRRRGREAPAQAFETFFADAARARRQRRRPARRGRRSRPARGVGDGGRPRSARRDGANPTAVPVAGRRGRLVPDVGDAAAGLVGRRDG